MPIILGAIFLFFSLLTNEQGADPINYMAISIELVERLERQESVDDLVDVLKKSTEDAIYNQIQTDNQKYAFWVNIYNAYIQVILKKFPDAYEDRTKFFKKHQIDIAGRTYSFAEIEHGILRRSQLGLFLGYVTNPFPAKHEKRLRVDKRDYRIHFALNCGAKSCPPVAAYHPDEIDRQFDFMTQAYLEENSFYNADNNSIQVTSLFSWFRGDFGGSSGIRDILQFYKIAEFKPERVTTLTYDWTLDLGNFRRIPLK